MKVQKVVVTASLGDTQTTRSLGFQIEMRPINLSYTVYGTLQTEEANNKARMRRFRDEISRSGGALSLHGESFVVSYTANTAANAEDAGAKVLSAGNYAFAMRLSAEEQETEGRGS